MAEDKKQKKNKKISVKKTVAKKIKKEAEVKKSNVKAKAKRTETKKVKKETKRSDLFVVIKTGGKQYLVKEGDVLEVEKLDIKEKEDVNFEDVLLVFDEKDIKIGTPKVDGAQVKAKVLSQKKGEKLIVFKYKPKKRYRKKTGHRQKLTEVEIQKIEVK